MGGGLSDSKSCQKELIENMFPGREKVPLNVNFAMLKPFYPQFSTEKRNEIFFQFFEKKIGSSIFVVKLFTL